MDLETLVSIFSLLTFPLFIGAILLVLNFLLKKDFKQSCREARNLVAIVYVILFFAVIIFSLVGGID